MADREADATAEVLILREKLQKAEDKLAMVNGALTESVLKANKSMTKLLTANDVNFSPAMRINILEIMNDYGRNLVGFFINKELVAGRIEDWWPPRFEKNASHNYG